MADAQLGREDAATLHLHLWLAALNRAIEAALAQRGAQNEALGRTASPAGTLAPRHAVTLLRNIDRLVRDGPGPLPPIALDRHELEAERQLIRGGPVTPPLERLARDASLSPFERAALLIAVAPEIFPDYRRLYGYLVDDLTQSHPSIALVLALTTDGSARQGSRRRLLGPGGALRRLGLLVTNDTFATSLATRLEPAPGLLDWLLGASAAPPVPLTDPRLIAPASVPASPLAPMLEPAARCLAANANAAVGLWGPEPGRHDDAVASLGRALGLGVFQAGVEADAGDWQTSLRQQAAIAAGAGAMLWIETRRLPPLGSHGRAAAALLAELPQRIVLTGRVPWRPIALLGARPYVDVALPPPHDAAWPLQESIGKDDAATLNERYRLGFRERHAAVRLALSQQRHRGDTAPFDFPAALSHAARLVATPGHLPSVVLAEPERRLDELVLPPDLHAQIAEISRLYRHAARVDGAWGFGRLAGSSGAVKVLFTGDPGTGKTMAAEVIAKEAGISLMKVDLSQIVSKWVGETEKNLEAVFDHAEQSRAALFFDEADALFGKRGEVRHGTDRYANLEVSYLLQRLDAFSGGLVILASNLRDEIDPAFTRRFQVALHFPRPSVTERQRLWQLAFAKAPLAPSVDLRGAAALDLTGGAIMTAARMAALLAAGDGTDRIGPEHIATATERQFRKEARLMTMSQPDGLSVARARG